MHVIMLKELKKICKLIVSSKQRTRRMSHLSQCMFGLVMYEVLQNKCKLHAC